ncbi:MAG: hypothetical protein JST80_13645 [Bdellovibrionales bacterium]|nr:hypothetical protein [Bdellovibrionales bacterium]
MILRTSLGLALALLAYTAYAQNTEYGSASVIACTGPADPAEDGAKRINVLIADAVSKTVSMSIQTKAGYPVYKISNAIVNIDNPMAPPPPPTMTEKPAKPVEPVKISKFITYKLQKPVKGADPIAAKLLVDSEKSTAIYSLGEDATASESYPLCRAFAADDYGAIYAWIRNQL